MIIDFVIPEPEAAAARGLSSSGAAGPKKAAADYCFHVAVTWWDESVHEDMGTLVARARRQQLQALHGLQERHHGRRRDAGEQLHAARSSSARLPTVHAENGELVFQLQQELLEAGHHRARRPSAVAPARGRGRGRQPRHPHRRGARRADLHRAQLLHASRSRRSRARAARASASTARCWPAIC